MDHIKALVIKFIATLALLYIVLGMFYDMAFRNVLLITIVLGAVSYIIGDLFILRRTNNTIATIADFGLAFLLIWFMGENLTYGDSLLLPSLIAAAGIALCEYIFHKYMANNVFEDANTNNNQPTKLRYQTEASEELTPERTAIKNENENRTE